jgi:hypothetical protein
LYIFVNMLCMCVCVYWLCRILAWECVCCVRLEIFFMIWRLINTLFIIIILIIGTLGHIAKIPIWVVADFISELCEWEFYHRYLTSLVTSTLWWRLRLALKNEKYPSAIRCQPADEAARLQNKLGLCYFSLSVDIAAILLYCALLLLSRLQIVDTVL